MCKGVFARKYPDIFHNDYAVLIEKDFVVLRASETAIAYQGIEIAADSLRLDSCTS
jgi:hypothetical protein